MIMEHNRDMGLKEGLDEIFNAMKREKCGTLIIHNNQGEMQLAQTEVLGRFRTAEDFVVHMVGDDDHPIAPAADGYLNWKIDSYWVRDGVCRVRIHRPFFRRYGWEDHDD